VAKENSSDHDYLLGLGETMTAQSVLVVGGDSVIGSSLFHRLTQTGFHATATTRRHIGIRKDSIYLDLGVPASFENILGYHYDYAVLCGAVTSLKTCEENPQQTRCINVDGTIALADLLTQEGSRLIFVSSNMVFDGKKPFAKASDTINPITEYGRQKALVEEYLLRSFAKAAVIRFGKVISPDFPLFVDWIAKLRAGEKIYPHANKKLAPITLSLATEILCWLIGTKMTGLFQFTASYDITYAMAAQRFAQLTRSDPFLIETLGQPCTDSVTEQSTLLSPFTTLEVSHDLSRSFYAPSPHEVVEYVLSCSTSETLR